MDIDKHMKFFEIFFEMDQDWKRMYILDFKIWS